MCDFCKHFKIIKDINNEASKRDELYEQYGYYKHEYTVTIITHSWFTKLGKRNAGRTVDYRKDGKGFKLNYCPECGKEL